MGSKSTFISEFYFLKLIKVHFKNVIRFLLSLMNLLSCLDTLNFKNKLNFNKLLQL